jgi:hypothetical protein
VSFFYHDAYLAWCREAGQSCWCGYLLGEEPIWRKEAAADVAEASRTIKKMKLVKLKAKTDVLFSLEKLTARVGRAGIHTSCKLLSFEADMFMDKLVIDRCDLSEDLRKD